MRAVAAVLVTMGLLIGLAAPAPAQQAPPRNRCTDDPGHVECINQLGGLVHGATVTTPAYRLTCRAVRLVWMRRYNGSSSRKRDEEREVAVAGACEQRSLDGALIERWTTRGAVPLKHISSGYFDSVGSGLPGSVMQRVHYHDGDHGRWDAVWFGYYFQGSGGSPSLEHWGALGGSYIWDRSPAYSSAEQPVESPVFSSATTCGPGYVVCTPYLKILHPDPEAETIVVHMVAAYRYQKQRRTLVYDYQRVGRHMTWTIGPPGPAEVDATG